MADSWSLADILGEVLSDESGAGTLVDIAPLGCSKSSPQLSLLDEPAGRKSILLEEMRVLIGSDDVLAGRAVGSAAAVLVVLLSSLSAASPDDIPEEDAKGCATRVSSPRPSSAAVFSSSVRGRILSIEILGET